MHESPSLVVFQALVVLWGETWLLVDPEEEEAEHPQMMKHRLQRRWWDELWVAVSVLVSPLLAEMLQLSSSRLDEGPTPVV